jgi:hypothetical protein
MKMEARKIALDKVFMRRNRYDIPDWQRDEVWTTERKQLLIDTILRGWKLPKLYFAKTSEDPVEYDVVDGQQRLATIFDFFGGQLRLSAESAALFGGSTHDSLPASTSDAFDDYEIEYDEITEASDEDLQRFFQRLQEGMQLTSAEKLNSVSSNLTKFARQLADHPFFMEKVAIRDTRKAYFDIISKVAAIAVDSIDVGLRYEDLKAVFESQRSFSSRSNVALRLNETLDYINSAFPTTSKVLRNRSTIQSFITLAYWIVESGRAHGTGKRFHSFVENFGSELARQVELGQDATDSDYLEFQRTLSANVKAGAKIRNEILIRKLLLFDLTWIDVLGSTALRAGRMENDIDRLGREIQRLVVVKNEEHASKQGTDLFKATNKTTNALAHLRDPITSFEEYSQLIENLYFIFREGVGQRLINNVPTSFEDVNWLRTGLQHDVDHGPDKRVAAKRKEIGQTFAKYAAGATSPNTLAPERFPIVQAALLKALANDLHKLTF